jgi:hypothetical protein
MVAVYLHPVNSCRETGVLRITRQPGGEICIDFSEAALDDWIHYCKWRRPHQGIGALPPMCRLSTSRSNPLTLHT